MRAVAALCLTLGLLLAQTAAGQQPADAAAKSEATPAAKALAAFKAEAGQFNISVEGSESDKLALEKEPVLRWTNPARTGEDGALFVWASKSGRPAVIGTIFTYRLGDKANRKHELHSLALAPLSAEFKGQTVWSPREAGLSFQPLEKAPAVAATGRQRLSQMKALARDFSASMRDMQDEQYQLRLLTQPLVRYEPKDEQVLDGAIFAFSLGTDPEVLLIIEARGSKDSHQWQYALARFHYIEITVQHLDRQVWRAEPLKGFDNLNLGAAQGRESIYTTYHVQRNIPLE
ncbi:MAG TPA: hypothetical protein VFB96_15670 [Pirellulaceae bacterium]|nr:hypothetical protein [Pirellulaceae bacterium]